MSAAESKEPVYHVIGLRAENFKRLKAVTIEFKDRVTRIKGRNKQGKSTIGDIITAVLGGARAAPDKPIRKGEDHGLAEVILGRDGKPALKATRVFNSEGHGPPTALKLENPEGGSLRSPQAVLDALCGALIDPFEFMNMEDAEQIKIVRQLVKGVDFDAIDALNRGDHDRRQDVNRDLKSVNAQLAAIQIPGDPRHTRIDESALVAELERAGAVATEIAEERARRQDAAREIHTIAAGAERYRGRAHDCHNRIATLQAEIKRLEVEAADYVQQADAWSARAAAHQAAIEALAPLPIAPDTTEIRARIDAARARNSEVDERERATKRRTELAARADALAAQSKSYTEAIAKRKQEIADAVARANLPISGLSFGEDQILLNDLPLSQASSAEQIDLSFRIQVALSPQIRVAFVREASMLDAETERQVIETAAAFDVPLILEQVANENDGVGIYIEDGMVKAREAEAAA